MIFGPVWTLFAEGFLGLLLAVGSLELVIGAATRAADDTVDES